MAELTVTDTTTDRCCAPGRQATCCEPSAKADCCGHGEGCGCDAGSTTGSTATPAGDLREQVRERYAAAAAHVTSSIDPGPAQFEPDGASTAYRCVTV